MVSNCPEFLYAWFGLMKIGAILVPINSAFRRTALVPFAADQSVFCIYATFCIQNISWREKLFSNTPKATAGT